MSYTIKLPFTLNQNVWITPFNKKGKIIEIHLMRSHIVYEVRHFQEESIAISYLYEEELENYTAQDLL